MYVAHLNAKSNSEPIRIVDFCNKIVKYLLSRVMWIRIILGEFVSILGE